MTTGSSHIASHVTGLFVCLLVSAVGYGLGVHPVVRARAQWQADVRELSQRQQTLTDYEENVSRVRERMTQVRDEIQVSTVAFKDVGILNQRLARLASLASQCGLVVHGVVPGVMMETTRCRLTPIRLAGQGGYQAAVTLLQQLHEDFPDIHVNGFVLRGDPQRPALTKNIELNLTWYAAGIHLDLLPGPDTLREIVDLGEPSPPGDTTVSAE